MGSEHPRQIIDVTPLVGSALPELLRGWQQARVLLVVVGTGPALPPANKGGLAPGALRRVKAHVEQHLADPVPLRDLARIAGLSDCHFARAFKRSVGISPCRFVTQQRVERAKDWLRDSDRAMADIALALGFSDQSHFTRAFLGLTGMTPSAFRKTCR